MYWSALILGFLGSMHCVVMCGPIALTLKSQNNLNRFVISRLLYNLGRLSTYALLGLVFGLLGQGLILANYQQLLSIGLGILMILFSILLFQRINTAFLNRQLSTISNSFRSLFSSVIKKPGLFSTYLVGLANGFLPCGLVYASLVGALAIGEIGKASLYMIIFGLGTIPAMLVVSLTGQFLGKRLNTNVHRFSSVFVFLLGSILIIRGLELSIPYLSPVIGFLYPLDAGITVCE
ncbi:sulfite exporter TauE/SafE family protein [Reichenbachiella ulvae]|uniref:Sulfite exporter TauE/SafE family protein n=1 Tax=Reichenbachiella ulvae TaxID=2980104 RepID=A0ABT3CRD4_9BACT|nr:sulfite exporter TauE/SafE family protein [Reichenbachiella ulvae]MCV9386260.1 sulfite exporter TauE/SafE family protein [Reichenbachiella ulvae]